MPSGFRIDPKTPTKHMGNGNLFAGADDYELPGVPWTSFFTGDGQAFHGTYWHENFVGEVRLVFQLVPNVVVESRGERTRNGFVAWVLLHAVGEAVPMPTLPELAMTTTALGLLPLR